MQVVLHRFVLAEMNTHRCFSRNSASSRAIPVKKQLERVMNDPAIPLVWPAEQSGMQGGDDLDHITQDTATQIWEAASEDAVRAAKTLASLGVHKSVTNRLLEPFMWHTICVTATEWDGFWDQRISPLAQPEIKAAAEAMKDAMDASEPRTVVIGGWHLPYIEEQDFIDAFDIAPGIELRETGTSSDATRKAVEVLKRVSTARCARTSYLTQEGSRDLSEDLRLYERLVSARPLHASPLEHVATPNNDWGPHHGNFRGWRQFRHDVEADAARQARSESSTLVT